MSQRRRAMNECMKSAEEKETTLVVARIQRILMDVLVED